MVLDRVETERNRLPYRTEFAGIRRVLCQCQCQCRS